MVVSLRQGLAAVAVAGATAAGASAASVEIQLGDIDVAYDGSTISSLDPINGTPIDTLTGADFFVDQAFVGRVDEDVFLGSVIDGVEDIPVSGGTVTSTAGGFFDVLFGMSGELRLSLETVTVTYLTSDSPEFEFVFVGSVASIFSQDLPFGLTLGEPVEVTVSLNSVDQLTDDGGFLTGFTASGTGEIVPEPTTAFLLAGSGLALTSRRRRRA